MNKSAWHDVPFGITCSAQVQSSQSFVLLAYYNQRISLMRFFMNRRKRLWCYYLSHL
jgi:hypothetical protein